ncbi:MAG TPA: methylated-DNA--[protein]-cysteine S-methyltransferase [Kofleriaceae bacterium]|nr:methylated-DNA--[protein]-cysteine S-methyltransferase [Kofleriaceae bacterium]
MSEHGFALFDTPIGPCGIAWGGRGIVGVQLPEGREAETRARVARRFPEAREAPPPRAVQVALDGIVALLGGQASDLSGVELDMELVPPFHRRVYEAARAIPPGETVSYGEIAARLGAPGAARAVGQALGRNPFAIVVPCHRVLAAGSRVGGFSARGGVTTKLRLLSIEEARDGDALFEGDGALGFDPVAAVAHVSGADPALARVIDAVGPLRLRIDRTPSIFLALAESIVYQQLTGKAAATIFARVQALFPRARESPTAQQILRVSDEKLRGAGLSRAKMLSLRDLARKTVDGEIPGLAEVHGMDDEEIVRRLIQVRGIGRWTVEMLLIFRLGRPDVLPVDDYGVRKGFGIALRKRELPGRKDLEKRGERWRPYRTVASWYLWRAVERSRK